MKALARRSAGTLKSVASFLARGTLDLVFPPHCLACGKPLRTGREALCIPCAEFIRPVDRRCPTCGTPRGPFAPDELRCDSCRNRSLHFDGAKGAFLYEGPVKRLLHRLKFERMPAAAKPLASLALARLEADPFPEDAHVAVPVPMHWMRRFRRGYNQSDLLARSLARGLGIPCVRALAKTRATDAQVDLPRSRRLEIPAGAFRARDARRIRGKTVLLVDDIMTTASTVSACARALKEGGAEKIWAFSIARQA